MVLAVVLAVVVVVVVDEGSLGMSSRLNHLKSKRGNLISLFHNTLHNTLCFLPRPPLFSNDPGRRVYIYEHLKTMTYAKLVKIVYYEGFENSQ